MNKNNLLFFKRTSNVEIDIVRIENCLDTIERPTWDEFAKTISPIWLKVLKGPGTSIKKVFDADVKEVKNLYENFFVNGLSDGAAIGSKMYELRSYLKILYREKRRFNILNNIALKQNVHFNYTLSDFGRPWTMKLGGRFVNFELTDHFYFADIALKLLKSFNISDVIFLGDGCGYLAQALLSFDNEGLVKNVTMIDLYHFLIRQFILLDGFREGVSMAYLNGERSDYPKTNSEKVLINQDSLPEINKEGQEKYFRYMKQNNVKIFISYNKVDRSKGHEEFRIAADVFFENKLLCMESAMRPGYWIEVWLV